MSSKFTTSAFISKSIIMSQPNLNVISYGPSCGVTDPRLLPAKTVFENKAGKKNKPKAATCRYTPSVQSSQPLMKPSKEYVKPPLKPNTSEDIPSSFQPRPLNIQCDVTMHVHPAKLMKEIPTILHDCRNTDLEVFPQIFNLKRFRYFANIIRANIDCNSMAHLIVIFRVILRRCNTTLNQMLEANLFDVLFQYLVNLQTQHFCRRLLLSFLCESIILLDAKRRTTLLEYLTVLLQMIKSHFLQPAATPLRYQILGLDTLVALQHAFHQGDQLNEAWKDLLNKNDLFSLIANYPAAGSKEIADLCRIILNIDECPPDFRELLFYTGAWSMARVSTALLDLQQLRSYEFEMREDFAEKKSCARLLFMALSNFLAHDPAYLPSMLDDGLVEYILMFRQWGAPLEKVVESLSVLFKPCEPVHKLSYLATLIQQKAEDDLLEALISNPGIGPLMSNEKRVLASVKLDAMILSSDDEDLVYDFMQESSQKQLIDLQEEPRQDTSEPAKLEEDFFKHSNFMQDLLEVFGDGFGESEKLTEQPASITSDDLIEIPLNKPSGDSSILDDNNVTAADDETLFSPGSEIEQQSHSSSGEGHQDDSYLEYITEKLDSIRMEPVHKSRKAANLSWVQDVVPNLQENCHCPNKLPLESLMSMAHQEKLLKQLKSDHAWQSCQPCLSSLLESARNPFHVLLAQFLGEHLIKLFFTMNRLWDSDPRENLRSAKHLIREVFFMKNDHFFDTFLGDPTQFIAFVRLGLKHVDLIKLLREAVFNAVSKARVEKRVELLQANLLLHLIILTPKVEDVDMSLLFTLHLLTEVAYYRGLDEAKLNTAGCLETFCKLLNPLKRDLSNVQEVRDLATRISINLQKILKRSSK